MLEFWAYDTLVDLSLYLLDMKEFSFERLSSFCRWYSYYNFNFSFRYSVDPGKMSCYWFIVIIPTFEFDET